jgi:hypothetical protein
LLTAWAAHDPDHGDEEQACRSRPGADRGVRDDFPQGWITRADRPDLSAVRSSLLPDEPAPEIFMTVQGDHAS